MKEMSEYLLEQLMLEAEDNNNEVKDNKDNDSNETIKNEDDFRAAAKAKFEEVFGDDLDVERMNMTIDGILDDNQDLVKDGKWGELIGMLNKSFGK